MDDRRDWLGLYADTPPPARRPVDLENMFWPYARGGTAPPVVPPLPAQPTEVVLLVDADPPDSPGDADEGQPNLLPNNGNGAPTRPREASTPPRPSLYDARESCVD